uniref:Uncharacterized protein n=1 Tax=Panagrolaimus davidi TaxID=227884 RepID=A0A914PPC1_9BILA
MDTTTAEKDGISDENKLSEKDGEIIGPENQPNELPNKVSEVIQKAAAAPASKSKSPPRIITVEPKPDNLLDPSSTPQIPLPSNENISPMDDIILQNKLFE